MNECLQQQRPVVVKVIWPMRKEQNLLLLIGGGWNKSSEEYLKAKEH